MSTLDDLKPCPPCKNCWSEQTEWLQITKGPLAVNCTYCGSLDSFWDKEDGE